MTDTNIIIEAFDIFDTVLTRTITPPNSAFYGLAQTIIRKYQLPYSASYIAEARKQAEARCKTNINHLTTIFDIYKEMQEVILLDTSVYKSLAYEELEYEKLITYPVPSILREIITARESGKKIIFISDMYFPATMLKELLEHHNILKSTDSIYVSCDHGVSKGEGSLFE